jgi:hypothetical protein
MLPISVFYPWKYLRKSQKPQDSSWFWVPVKMVSVDWKPNMIEEQCLCKEIMGTKATTLKNLSWVRVLLKVISLAWKPSPIEEWCQDQSCLFRQGDYKNKGNKQPQKSNLGLSPGEDGFCSSVTKQDRRIALSICKHVSICQIYPQ